MSDSIQFDAHYIACGDAHIAYYSFGQGDPLILLHGNGESSTYFSKCIPYLSHFYRVIAVDSRGHGRSGRGEGPLSFDRMAEDLRVVLDGLGIEKAHILGFSDGGNLAIKFALLYPQRVDKLILNGANVSMLRGVVPWVQLPLYPAVGMLSVLAPLGADYQNKRDVLRLMTHGYGVRLRDLKLIDQETLVVVGEHDMIRAAHTRAMVRELPHAHLAILQGSHFIAAESPARFCLNCLRFLQGGTVPDAVPAAWAVEDEKVNRCM